MRRLREEVRTMEFKDNWVASTERSCRTCKHDGVACILCSRRKEDES